MPLLIATWNVNSIKARLTHVLRWLEEAQPDILCLQELKCQEDGFPRLEIEGAGYHAAVVGQKSYNGVALLARQPIDIRHTRLPGDEADEQARYLEADIGGLRVASIYLPNGNGSDEKYAYKLNFMERLRAHMAAILNEDAPAIFAGDYNVIPSDLDCQSPEDWREDALFRPQTLAKWRGLLNLGLYDGFRVHHKDGGHYSFWDYQGGAWQRDNGIRIDHLLLSAETADKLTRCGIDRTPRGWDKASDHTPVWAELAL